MTGLKKWLKRHGMLLAIFVLVALAFVTTSIIYFVSQDWTAAGTVALAGFGAIGIIFSYITMAEMKRDKRPYVYADIVLDKRTGHLLYAVVENRGNSPAHNIRFEVAPSDFEDDMVKDEVQFYKFGELPIIKHPILFLPHEDGRKTIYGNTIGMKDYFSKITYKIHVKYENSDGTPYDEGFTINLGHLNGISDIQEPYLKALNDIKTEINSLKDSLGKIEESQKIQSGIYGYCKIHEHVANPKTGDCIICRSEKQDQKKANEEKNSKNTINGGEI